MLSPHRVQPQEGLCGTCFPQMNVKSFWNVFVHMALVLELILEIGPGTLLPLQTNTGFVLCLFSTLGGYKSGDSSTRNY